MSVLPGVVWFDRDRSSDLNRIGWNPWKSACSSGAKKNEKAVEAVDSTHPVLSPVPNILVCPKNIVSEYFIKIPHILVDLGSELGLPENNGTEALAEQANGMAVPIQPNKQVRADL